MSAKFKVTSDASGMRNRRRYLVAIAVVFVLGLPTRVVPEMLPPFVVNYAGDALWALAIFLGLGFIFRQARTRTLFITAMLMTWGIEFSELYQADWINQLRSIKLFALILGYTFLPVDLVSYTVDILTGVALEKLILWRKPDASVRGHPAE